MAPTRTGRRSPTAGLLVGLLVTLAGVVAVSWYVSRQISGLRALQIDLAERNRKDSLQLLRIQNALNSIGLAMRDMLDNDSDYPLTAWSAQFGRIRADLDDALRLQEQVAVARRTPEQNRFLAASLEQFWDAADRMFAIARVGNEADARTQIRLSLQARQAALGTTVARLLVENNEREEQTARRVGAIYDAVQRQVQWFLAGTLVAIALTSLSLIRSNRRVFAELELLSDRRREIAQQLIAAREATLKQISRELHDELGQVLTAMGSMIGRAGRQIPEDSPVRADVREVQEIAQSTLEKVRALSQALHPSMLEEAGLEKTIEWYLSTVERQLGLRVVYERTGQPLPIDDTMGIHVYRVLQEALNNVARHSGATEARVRLHIDDDRLQLEVEDRGSGISSSRYRRGLGIVTMRERAELVGGRLELDRAPERGTTVRLTIPKGNRPGGTT